MTLTELMPYIWLAAIVLSVVCEAATAGLVSIWFIPPALIAFILSVAGIPVWLQTLVFFVGSVALLILSRTVFKNLLHHKKPEATNLDSVVGMTAVVVEDIDNISGTGAVKVAGKVWTARSSDDGRRYYNGDIVTVEKIEGVKLICR